MAGREAVEMAAVGKDPFGDDDISILPLRLGLSGQFGVIVAGFRRADFPEKTERLVLGVAANQAQ